MSEYVHYKNVLDDMVFDNNITCIDKKIHQSMLYQSVVGCTIYHEIKKIIVSLSGGVDSMVLLEILYEISKHRPLEIIACHLNYKNRSESDEEEEFLKMYCGNKGITLVSRDMNIKRGDIKRSEYEKHTRKLRYEFYLELCRANNTSGVMLGHHKDDIVENVFNNIMRGGREISDLRVLCEKNIILDVTIYRPFINHQKKDVYDIAYAYNIPYFKDTTPDWSCRGKMRRNIFPALSDCYTEKFNNSLLQISDEGEMLGNIIDKYIINDISENICVFDNGFSIPNEKALHEVYILKKLLRNIFHKLNIECMKLKNICILSELLKENCMGKVKSILINKYSIFINDDEVVFKTVHD